MEIFLIFGVSVIIGCLVGGSKGQLAAGVIFSILLGPLGVLIVLCLPNRVKEKAEQERKEQADIQLHLQRQQLKKLEELQELKFASIPPPPAARTYHVACDGEDIGELAIGTINQMLRSGRLTREDHYFDAQLNEWRPLQMLAQNEPGHP